jgi:hypothetical protein
MWDSRQDREESLSISPAVVEAETLPPGVCVLGLGLSVFERGLIESATRGYQCHATDRDQLGLSMLFITGSTYTPSIFSPDLGSSLITDEATDDYKMAAITLLISSAQL